jgi:hypothetical protein
MSSVAGAARPRAAAVNTRQRTRSADANAFTVAVLSIAATLIAAYDLCILALSLH